MKNLEIDQTQLAAEAGRTVEAITSGMSPKDAKDFQKSEYLWGLMNSIMADMMTQQSMTYLRAIAKGDPLPNEVSDEPETEEGEDVPEKEATPDVEADLEGSAEEDTTPEAELESETVEETAEEGSAPETEETPEVEEPASETEEDEPESK